MHLNRKWPFCNHGAWFDQIFRQIVPMTEKTLKNTKLVGSRHIKREHASLPVDVRHYYLLLRLIVTGDEAQGTMGRGKMRGATRLARFLLSAFLCAQILSRERRLGKRQNLVDFVFRSCLKNPPKSAIRKKKSLLYVWREIFNASSTFPLAK